MLRRVLSMLFLLLVMVSPLCLARTPAYPNMGNNAGTHLAQVRGVTHAAAFTGDNGYTDNSGYLQANGVFSNTPMPRLVVNVKGGGYGKADGRSNVYSARQIQASAQSETSPDMNVSLLF